MDKNSYREKKTGDTKNGTFLQIALNIALDIDCFLSLTVKYQKIFWKNCRILYLTGYIWLIVHDQRLFIAPVFLGSRTVLSFNLFLFVFAFVVI